jgi:hypothetical protein
MAHRIDGFWSSIDVRNPAITMCLANVAVCSLTINEVLLADVSPRGYCFAIYVRNALMTTDTNAESARRRS